MNARKRSARPETRKGSTPPAVAGIFGCPVAHTLSPSMQNAAFAACGLPWTYVPFEVRPEHLGDAVRALRSLNIRGVNVTVPHKENVMRFLDRVDPLARSIGSVNTIVNNGGILEGYNTDATGFLKDLSAQGFRPKGKTVLLVGAGGAGRAVASALSRAGAARILITDKEASRANRVARQVPRARAVPFSRLELNLEEADILINATPVGLHRGDTPFIKTAALHSDLFVYDLIYNRDTELLKAARTARARSSGGLGMLLCQGALAFELFTGKKAPMAVMRTALKNALKQRS